MGGVKKINLQNSPIIDMDLSPLGDNVIRDGPISYGGGGGEGGGQCPFSKHKILY